ncbi:DUF6153 family protein [Streptomyces sp. JNUCC 64]
MRTSRTLRTVGAWGHLLLVAALALGVFMMHTVGHPDASSGSAAHGSAPVATAHGGAASLRTAADPVVSAAPDGGEHGEGSSSPHGSGAAMDLASLCVAVLGAWVVAALLRAAFLQRAEWLVRLRAGALRVLLPLPPPRAPDLFQLSILRI